MRPGEAPLEEIQSALRRHRSFCVVGHVRPDGDCIGSQLALGLALEVAGKDVVVWNDDAVPPKLRFLDPENRVRKPKPGQSFDCVVATDAASFERLGRTGECVSQRALFINIDHHRSNTRYADLNWICPDKPSTGELVYELLRSLKWEVTRAIADCLFTAISTDTGSFQYPSTRPETYRTAGELVERGADLSRICNEVYQSFPLSRVRLLRHVYNRFRLTHDDRIAYLWLKKSDYSRAGATPAESEGLIDHIRSIEPVLVAALFEEIEEQLTRVSLRSKHPGVDVNRIASQFGGGGHSAAAGLRVAGSPLSAQRKVIGALRQAINQLP